MGKSNSTIDGSTLVTNNFKTARNMVNSGVIPTNVIGTHVGLAGSFMEGLLM